tara:strand:- start:2742 stop:3020 length:279 start_codon:yes stop_codon:yes gene_type:complete
MVIETKHGDFEVNEITRKQRREHYKEVKKVFNLDNNLEEMHELADKFTLLAFGTEKKADEALKGLSALEEDEVLSSIIVSYMGLDLGNLTGD